MQDDGVGKLPHGVALSWGLVKPAQRGPKRELSIEKIVETAVAIADKDGLAAVSMNRVASALGFTTMSLYRYISSKDDLLLLMQDAVCDVPIPPEDADDSDWREQMRQYVWLCVGAMREHPWFVDIPISGVPVTPNNLKVVDFALRTMRAMPLNGYEKMSIVLLLSGYARTCGQIQRDFDRAVQAGSSPGSFSGRDYTTALQQLITPGEFPNLYPVVMSGAYTEKNEEENTVGNDFDFGLERILDGVEHFLNQKA